ncbi:MAG TPA: UDP-N-acetylglucosamine 2-epimerase (non-hydrolyzing), partial [Longimicrobiales bacterium]|nr:UDP-N-acetylglucosamine 2-epimerase (non-hydrolyzing) [Longimicrobiales bacterium]
MAPRALIVIGTRPEAIKMAPVVDALRARAPDVETRVALTGQHTRLVDQVLEVFALEPDYDLGIMQEGQSLHDVMRLALAGLKGVLEDARPDVVLVEGDTATVFAGALAGFFERTKVGHVEAGLRTGDRWAPFPEEMLRRLTDVVADWHFAPTKRAVEALLAEGLPPEHVHLTGNTVVDALLAVRAQARPVRDPALARVLSEPGARVVLLTAHRRESFGRPLENVFAGVRALADRAPDVHVVYPVHPNPNVAGPARERLADHPRVHLTEPLDYPDLVTALERASLVLTDSGGIQEEAPTLGTPVLVLREKTERPEAVEAGVAERVGTDPDALVARGLEALRRGRTPL